MVGKMKVPISIYATLSDIARRYGVRQIEWAKASGLSQPRIAELEMKLRAERKGEGFDPIRHVFTMQKMKLLYLGLQKIIGENAMSKEMERFIESNKDNPDAIVLMSLESYTDPEFTKTLSELIYPAYLKRKAQKGVPKE